MADKKLLSCKMAADRLGLSTVYIRMLCRTGRIKAEKLSKDWLIPLSSIRNIKRQRKQKGI